MVYAGECKGYGRTQAMERFRYTRQRYYHILK